MRKLNLITVVLAVLLWSVSGWGACTSRSYAGNYLMYWTTCPEQSYCEMQVSNIFYRCGSDCDPCSFLTLTSNQACSFSPGSACSGGSSVGCSDGSSGKSGTTSNYQLIVYTCESKCEADSIACELAGNIWQTDISASCGKSCKVNHCTAADTTWLSTSIAACTGSNNYAIVNTDSTCEHVGTCCPNDSIPSGNTCKWRCDSVLTACSNRTGDLFGAVLPDTSVSGEDTTFSYQCFYNCAHSPNPDSTVYIVEGNTVLAGPNDSIADGIKSEWFSSIRSTTGSIYVYDYLSPSASEYVDSITAMKCVEHLWRCVINNKYVYWYDNQEVPAGCTNIVRVK